MRKAAIIIVAGLILIAGFSYGVMVGKYQYPPYRQLASLSADRVSSLKQLVASKSAKFQEEGLKAEEDRLLLVSTVVDSVFDVIMSSYKSFDVTLDSILGYTIGYSVRSGTSLPVYIHNIEKISVDVYRLARAKTKVEAIGTLSPTRQSPSFSPYQGFDWDITLKLKTDAYRSGYYLVELTGLDSGTRYQIPFVITPIKTPRIAFVSQTNTWHAYNAYGGLSNYRNARAELYGDDEIREYNGGLDALSKSLEHVRDFTHLPYARPDPQAQIFPPYYRPASKRGLNITDRMRPEDPHDEHLLRSEWNLIAFAEEHQLDYGVYTDTDFVTDGQVLESDVIVFNTHNEYWSKEMLNALRQYLSKGGKVVFAGGDSITREVKHTKYGMQVIKRVIPTYMSTPLMGAPYTSDGVRTYGGYKVLNSGHWVFNDTGVDTNDEIGVYSANKAGAGSRGEGGVGASGWETGEVNEYSEGFQILAIGTNEQGPAHMVFKETDAGGWIFNASSITFAGALLHDPVIDKMMLNLLSGNHGSDGNQDADGR